MCKFGAVLNMLLMYFYSRRLPKGDISTYLEDLPGRVSLCISQGKFIKNGGAHLASGTVVGDEHLPWDCGFPMDFLCLCNRERRDMEQKEPTHPQGVPVTQVSLDSPM